jgi:hypothetical protein
VAETAYALFIIVDVLGIAGAVLVALPFFREFALKRLVHWLHQPTGIPGLERATHASAQIARVELERFRPRDGAHVAWGLMITALSYLLHIVAEVFEHLAEHP